MMAQNYWAGEYINLIYAVFFPDSDSSDSDSDSDSESDGDIDSDSASVSTSDLAF